ncbi:unnamed protein product [Nyctereutes procyonoides]|uniref:(raccoon dog) hypothetical protein n=1 Tax=Nyctereutes procyonoides TaxID=34880 RepID=A0A811XVF9_NYCPR|nr:unnamed protein product [Nyctereutes procyonoides]
MVAQLPESDQTKHNLLFDFVKDFITREVKPEIICSEHCLWKYLKMTQSISMRFQEYHIWLIEALAAKAGFWPTRIEKS